MSTGDKVDISPEKARQFANLQKEAKDLAGRGYLQESLDLFLKAKAIYPSKKILSRIERLKDALKRVEEEEKEDDDEMIQVAEGYHLYHEIYNKLFPYQRLGVAWMWGLYKKGKGGILGDDMGLGKTIQVIAFLSGMIDAKLVKSAIIIMPVSLIQNWKKEFRKWCPGIDVSEFHGGSKKEREQNLNRIQRRGGIILTSYGMTLGNHNLISKLDGRDFIWDYVILDEGHKIKNPSKTTKVVHEIPSKNRIVLTGTPIQNNLQELWALFDFAHHGTLLGSCRTFKMQYEIPITRSREKDCSKGERELGMSMAENLRNLIEPYFLRRTKDILDRHDKKSNEVDELGEKLGEMKVSSLSRKNDFIVWVFLSQPQYAIYKDFLQSDTVKEILTVKRSPLVQLTILKKICDHPRLLSHRSCLQLGLNGSISEEELNRVLEDESSGAVTFENVSDKTLMEESGKLEFAVNLLENLRQSGHRTLVFSLSRKILDMIQRILVNKGWKVLRVDGTVSKMMDREKRIQLFQRDSTYPVFLLTTQVGGVGITLTAADRVIIYDPSWNPATDAQAVDRVYRIGQKKDVVVYRLITCGSIEEKIYRRQIFKDSITRQATSSSLDPHRYFTKQELRELFTVDDIHYSNTQVQLANLHANERKTDTHLDEHIAFLHSLNIFGISDHDLMFTKDIKDENEDDDTQSVTNDYIKKRVEMAEQLVKNEAAVVEEGLKCSQTYVKPYTLHIPASAKKSVNDHYQPPQFPDETGDKPFIRVMDSQSEQQPYKSGLITPGLNTEKFSESVEDKPVVKSLFPSYDFVDESASEFSSKKQRVQMSKESSHVFGGTKKSDVKNDHNGTIVLDKSIIGDTAEPQLNNLHLSPGNYLVNSSTPVIINKDLPFEKTSEDKTLEAYVSACSSESFSKKNFLEQSTKDDRKNVLVSADFEYLINDGKENVNNHRHSMVSSNSLDISSREVLSELENSNVNKSTPIQCKKILDSNNNSASVMHRSKSESLENIHLAKSSSLRKSALLNEQCSSLIQMQKDSPNYKFEDFPLFDEVAPRIMGKLSKRKSCANPRISAVMLSDSDSSTKSSPSGQYSAEIIVSDSEDSADDESYTGSGYLEESSISEKASPVKTPDRNHNVIEVEHWQSTGKTAKLVSRKTVQSISFNKSHNPEYKIKTLDSPDPSKSYASSMENVCQDALNSCSRMSEVENHALDQSETHSNEMLFGSIVDSEEKCTNVQKHFADISIKNDIPSIKGNNELQNISVSGQKFFETSILSENNPMSNSVGHPTPKSNISSVTNPPKNLLPVFQSPSKYASDAENSSNICSPRSEYGMKYKLFSSCVKRITPMRVVNEKPSPKKTPFEKAIEKSVELQPITPQKIEVSLASEADYDSPILSVKKTARKILSESESDGEEEEACMPASMEAVDRRNKCDEQNLSYESDVFETSQNSSLKLSILESEDEKVHTEVCDEINESKDTNYGPESEETDAENDFSDTDLDETSGTDVQSENISLKTYNQEKSDHSE